MSHVIRVDYSGQMLDTDAWEELLRWTIDTFGLPDQYADHPGSDYAWFSTEEYMTFVFESEADALIFQLRSLGTRIHE